MPNRNFYWAFLFYIPFKRIFYIIKTLPLISISNENCLLNLYVRKGLQGFSQHTRDYGDKESKVIQNTIDNVFSGQVVGETAKTLSDRFGKMLQKRQSMTVNREENRRLFLRRWIV